ncbi:MAG TPA: S9 family peptidase [Ktedonobacterales bacterium]
MSEVREGIGAGAALAGRVPVTVASWYGANLRGLGDVQLSPDGKRVALILGEWVPGEQQRRARLFVMDVGALDTAMDTKAGEPRPVTGATRGDACPRWSPDGRWLAYTSRCGSAGADDRPQLYVMPAAGGEGRRVCQMPDGVSDLEWSPDGTRIAFLARERSPEEGDPIVVRPGPHRRLWTVRPESDVPEVVTPDGLTIWECAWSPDGTRLACYFATGPDETDWYRGQIGIVDARGGALRQITELTGQAAALAWSPDGERLAYIAGEWSDPGLVGGDLYVMPAAGGEARNLTPGIEMSIGWCRWFPGGERLLYTAWDSLTHQVGILRADDGARTVLDPDFLITIGWCPRLSTTPDLRRFATAHADPASLGDVWMGELAAGADGREGVAWRRLTTVNPLAEATLDLAPSERISYTGVDGWRIDALFTPPARRVGDGPPPLLVNVHGGPSGLHVADTGGLWVQLFASAGYAVLSPNPRGSMGRGVAFADAVMGDVGGKDYLDILAGVDHLVAHGRVDADRVGILGWSYGGYMTAWAVTQTTRFKAAMMGAGISDWHNFHAQGSLQDSDVRQLGVDPLEHPEQYRERSPITYAGRVHTPTLILHGERDQPVPVAQAFAFYRALRERDVPVELVVYPREGHGFRERAHLIDLFERMLAWFARYL